MAKTKGKRLKEATEAGRKPSGRTQEYGALEGRRWYRLREGQGQAEVVTPGKPAR